MVYFVFRFFFFLGTEQTDVWEWWAGKMERKIYMRRKKKHEKERTKHKHIPCNIYIHGIHRLHYGFPSFIYSEQFFFLVSRIFIFFFVRGLFVFFVFQNYYCYFNLACVCVCRAEVVRPLWSFRVCLRRCCDLWLNLPRPMCADVTCMSDRDHVLAINFLFCFASNIYTMRMTKRNRWEEGHEKIVVRVDIFFYITQCDRLQHFFRITMRDLLTEGVCNSLYFSKSEQDAKRPFSFCCQNIEKKIEKIFEHRKKSVVSGALRHLSNVRSRIRDWSFSMYFGA